MAREFRGGPCDGLHTNNSKSHYVKRTLQGNLAWYRLGDDGHYHFNGYVPHALWASLCAEFGLSKDHTNVGINDVW